MKYILVVLALHNTSVGRRQGEVLRKEQLPDAELLTFYAARNVDAAYDVDSRVWVLLAAAQHKEKGLHTRAGREKRIRRRREGRWGGASRAI